MCGIMGISGSPHAAAELAFGLEMLQHRGQDAAGILTFSRRFHLCKAAGLVSAVFDRDRLERLEGGTGVGHVRYATQGANDEAEAQPFYINYPIGIGMIHNGNIVNFDELARRCREVGHHVVESRNDLELLLYTFTTELIRAERDSERRGPEQIFEAVRLTQGLVRGAYAAIAVIPNYGLLGFCDPFGIRPLLLGRRQNPGGPPTWLFASESSALEIMGFEVLRQVDAGQALLVDREGVLHERRLAGEARRFCVFEYIYFSREDSQFFGAQVAQVRGRMGRALAARFHEKGLRPEVVIDVPSSSWFFAESLAEELGVPFRKGFVKNKYVGRSFIMASPGLRNLAVRRKLNPLPAVVRGKRVAVVDDSLVRGTTSRHIVQLLRDCGAREIYFVSAAPPVRHPCFYGIDMALTDELLAASRQPREIAALLGADALIYQRLDDLESMFSEVGICSACFSGSYPVAVPPEQRRSIDEDRRQAQAGAASRTERPGG